MAEAPHTFEELLDAINQKMFMLQATWKIYRQLFGTNQERLDLLNTWVPSFTGIAQRVFWDQVILGICRLCDPPVQFGNENLTLQRLIDSLDPRPDVAQSAFFDGQLTKIRQLSKELLQHRHKRLAHSDLQSALATTDLLPGISRQVIEDVLRAIRELLNAINLSYLKHEVGYELVNLRGDGDGLIRMAQKAEQLFKLQDDSWSGKMPVSEVVEKLRNRMLPEI